MKNPDEFDAFYKDTRNRLLLQTYALTGDLPASRAAVRDSFVVAWHHWRKISRLSDREGWARPRAWSHAQRRHTARRWHRDKSLDSQAKATLEALGKLPLIQRKVLLLTHLTQLSKADLAREVGLPLAEAERTLEVATAQFAMHRDLPAITIRPLLEPLRERVEAVTWPRSSIVRRAGAARRRLHTTIGALLVVVAVGLSGSLVTDVDGVRPSLATKQLTPHRPGPGRGEPTPHSATFSQASLLSEAPFNDLLPGTWSVTSTDDNSNGDGLALPCQQTRYADPAGMAAALRTFAATPNPKRADATAAQFAEISETKRAARRTYGITLDWFAGCTDARVQLLSTRRVDDVGDRAMFLVLRSHKPPVTTMAVGVAQSGRVTTTLISQVADDKTPDFPSLGQLLAEAVDGVCALPEGGACAGKARMVSVAPLPVGEFAAMLSEVDLPPVAGVARRWVGTTPQEARENVASTTCDRADFSDPMSNNVTKTFLIPTAELAPQFGLTETVGSLPVDQAQEFIAKIRSRMAACPEKNLASDVTKITGSSSEQLDLSVWRVTTRVSAKVVVTYLMAIFRDGTSLGQLTFVPDGKAEITTDDFVKLAKRALDRVHQLPRPVEG